MPKRKKYLKFIFKFFVSFSIIAFLLIFRISVKDIFAHIKSANLFWVVVSFSLHSLGLIISAIRWKILIQAHGDHVPLTFLIKSYLVGSFFNNFLPTRFGGDLVRIWDGSQYSKSILKSSAIILVERLTGIIVLLLFVLTASLIRIDMAQKVPVIWIALSVGILGLLLIIGFFMPFSEKLIAIIPEKGFFKSIKDKIIDFRGSVFVYKKKKAALIKALFWAFLLQINVILHYYLVGKALNLSPAVLDYFVFIPIVLIILIIPVTIGGHGLREGAYTKIFAFYGISGAAAIAFSAIADIAFTLIIGILGGIIYIFRKKQIHVSNKS